MVRMASSRRVVIELAADTRSERSDDGLERVRERPIQGSLLLFPARAVFSPYVLAGYGLYNRTVETLDATGATVASASERRTGAHVGFGAELLLGRHAAFVVDYRYRFVKFGAAEEDASPVNLPGLGSRLSHKGTMWTTGVAIYF
jgi:opacity protein-like surface antigen